MTRCLNGRNAACVRSKEITAMFVRETRGRTGMVILNKVSIFPSRGTLLKRSHVSCIKTNGEGLWESRPTNISATVKLITKYMARVRRFLFFIKTIIVRRLTDTIINDSVTNTASKVIHLVEENILNSVFLSLFFFFCCL